MTPAPDRHERICAVSALESTIADLRTRLAVAEARVNLLERANGDTREAVAGLDLDNRRLRNAIRALVDTITHT